MYNWADLNNQVIKALGLEGKPIRSIDMHFSPDSCPTVDIEIELGYDESGENLLTELRSYELIERVGDT